MSAPQEPTAREVRETLAYLLGEVRAMQGADGLVADVRRAQRAGDGARVERGLRRVEDLFRVCQVMLETVRWPVEET
jgi:hypothetical protein